MWQLEFGISWYLFVLANFASTKICVYVKKFAVVEANIRRRVLMKMNKNLNLKYH